MTNEQHTDGIMALVRNIREDSIIREIVLNALQDAYRRGADSIRNSPDYNYREDMGR